MKRYLIKGWEKFQHFKDRTPPWIKLYRDILDDPDWHELDGDTAKTLVMLWVIASEDETHSGALPDTRKLAFRLRISEAKLNQQLTKLSHWLIQDDINTISEGYQVDAPERAGEETEIETETERDKPTSSSLRSEDAPLKPSAKKTTFNTWIKGVRERNEKAISTYTPVWTLADKLGLPREWIEIAWIKFSDRYGKDPNHMRKQYTDWRRAFRNAVEDNWFKLWYPKDGGFVLTAAGVQADMATREAA